MNVETGGTCSDHCANVFQTYFHGENTKIIFSIQLKTKAKQRVGWYITEIIPMLQIVEQNRCISRDTWIFFFGISKFLFIPRFLADLETTFRGPLIGTTVLGSAAPVQTSLGSRFKDTADSQRGQRTWYCAEYIEVRTDRHFFRQSQLSYILVT